MVVTIDEEGIAFSSSLVLVMLYSECSIADGMFCVMKVCLVR